MYKSLAIGSVVVLIFTAPLPAFSQETGQNDCAMAERYYSLAQQQRVANKEGAAADYLEKAAATCPRYAYFQELGELRMGTADRFDLQAAVEAFVQSHALASSDKERARALWKYADLLHQQGDPQNADRLIRDARKLDADNQEIAELAAAIQEQIENPTREALVRGLASSLYQPLQTQASSSQVASVDSSPAT